MLGHLVRLHSQKPTKKEHIMRIQTVTTLLTLLICATLGLSQGHSQSPKSAAKTALVVTWQDPENKLWYGVGPTQRTSFGEKEEKTPLERAGGGDKGKNASFKEKRGIYNIYTLNRQLESFDIDARDFLKTKGIALEY